MRPALRALVLDGHSRAAVETVQSLGRRGVLVHVAAETSDSLAFCSGYPERRFRQPSQTSVPSFVDWLRELDAEHDYTLIVPATEVSLLGFIGVSRNDPLREKAVLGSDEALNTAIDKQRTGELASRLGIPVPRSILIRNDDALTPVESYPVILKPIRSQVLIGGEMTTLSTGVVRDASERRDYLERWLRHGPVLQQEYIPGFGVGIGLLYERGRKVWHFAYERIHELPLTGGASSYRRSVAPDPRLLSVAEQLLNELEWHGVAMVEFRVSGPGDFSLMEINPRLWGSLALAIDSGVDFPRGLLSLASRESPGAQPLYRHSQYTRDVQSDLRWLKANTKADRRDPLLLTRGRVATLLELFRPLTGRESWDHFDWRDLAVTRSVLASAVSDTVRSLESRVQKKKFEWEIGRHHHRVLRDLEHAGSLPKRILLLCHGNICRSPLAARLATVRLAGCEVWSAGLDAQQDGSTPPHFLRAARSLGVDLTDSRPSVVTIRDVTTADLILVMDAQNYREFSRQFPEALRRTTLLGLFASGPSCEIRDPYVSTERETHAVLQHIAAGVDGLVRWVASREPRGRTGRGCGRESRSTS
jgi:protein-tyrosine-phosphatase/predicted ATP-grasp superfamily ATP-dependent carboligase